MSTFTKTDLKIVKTELTDVVDAVLEGKTVWKRDYGRELGTDWAKVTCVDTGYKREDYFIGENPEER